MPAQNRQIFSVTDINKYIKAVITNDSNLKYIYVKGELSNFKRGLNGHCYFSLKDKECLINVALFNNYAAKLTFEPENGQEVVVLASVDVYPSRGTYQLLAYEMNPVGLGDQLVELEALKRQLQSEGLFDLSRKRKINIFPDNIGVITAKNSAAIKDIVTNIKRRYPVANIYIFYSAVQGESAPKELLKAFKKSQEYPLDTLIIGRGGGASEDLSAFNDEALVRAIAESKMPVISAVGHEIDSTLVDYVADVRASTPTGAAELATVDVREIEQRFNDCIEDMKNALHEKVDKMKDDVESYKEDLNNLIKDKISDYQWQVKNLKERLNALNPKDILNRGYSISTDEYGKIISSINTTKFGDIIRTVLKDGTLVSVVKETEAK